MKLNIRILTSALLCTFLSAISLSAASPGDVVINELAWKTEASSGDEWIEFYNTTDSDIDLTGWVIRRERDGKEVTFADDAGDTGINLINSTIPANGYFLIERINAPGDSSAVFTSTGDFQSKDLYNFLQTAGENLTLKDSGGTTIDNVDCSGGWFAGDNDNSFSMEKVDPELDGNLSTSWKTYRSDIVAPYEKDSAGNDIYGTPGQQNSVYGMVIIPPDMPESYLKVEDSPFFPRGDKSPEEAQIAYRNLGDDTAYATITIYNTGGYAVRNLLKYTSVSSDDWDYITWNGEDDFNNVLPMGVYIVHLKMEVRDGGGIIERQAPVVLGRKF